MPRLVSDSGTAVHTGPATWTLVDGTRVLRIAGSPFAAMPDPRDKNTWTIFYIPGRQIVAYTRGDKADARIKLIERERQLHDPRREP